MLEENNQEMIMKTTRNSNTTRNESKHDERSIASDTFVLGRQSFDDTQNESKESEVASTSSSLLKNRSIVAASFAPNIAHILLAAYLPKNGGEENNLYGAQSLLAVWDMNNTSYAFR